MGILWYPIWSKISSFWILYKEYYLTRINHQKKYYSRYDPGNSLADKVPLPPSSLWVGPKEDVGEELLGDLTFIDRRDFEV